MLIIWIILIFLILIMLGMPIGLCMGFTGVSYFILSGQEAFMPMLPNYVFNGLNSFVLMALPLFMLAGEIMDKAKISDRLVNFANLIVGRMEGGLAQVNVLSSMLFAGITGVALGDVAALGKIFIPAMSKEGYDKPFSAAITASSSLIGPIIPPSIVIVIYCAVEELSVGGMFAAALLPGLLKGLGDMVIVNVLAKKRGYPKRTISAKPIEYALGLKDALLAILMPIIILGGIVLGVFTPTEAAAAAVAYALVVSIIIYRNLKVKELPPIIYSAAYSSAKLFFILAFIGIISWVFGFEDVPGLIRDFVLSHVSNKYVILLLLNLFLVFVGMWMTEGAAIILFAPMLAPLAYSVGLHPFTWGIIMIMNLVMGLITPPVGVILYATADIAGLSMEKVFKAILPMFMMNIFVVFLLNVFPSLTTYLPKVLGFID
ncbi:TRAP transporter large permease [uncultured Desulfosarcina sp.]|uniref:TRAP transporter large permease n=1 Tax=uncultured Desulfosarcina sp. TaxID=218289 RepID=UPI0029C8E6C5|nr:TRAP transporter large permease [uncultured Desulfosarcina sp.]